MKADVPKVEGKEKEYEKEREKELALRIIHNVCAILAYRFCKKKEIAGPKRTTAIRMMEKDDDQIVLQGYEIGLGWTLAIDRATGNMRITFAGSESAFIIFGACTAYP